MFNGFEMHATSLTHRDPLEQILDADKSGVIELNDIQARYDASKHPDVITGRRTKDEILR